MQASQKGVAPIGHDKLLILNRKKYSGEEVKTSCLYILVGLEGLKFVRLGKEGGMKKVSATGISVWTNEFGQHS